MRGTHHLSIVFCSTECFDVEIAFFAFVGLFNKW